MHTFATVVEDMVTECCGNAVVRRRADISCERLLETIAAEGEILKISPRSETRRVNGLVVKGSAGGALKGLLERSIRRNRFRRGWAAGLYLEQQGVSVPRVEGFVETGRWGMISGSYLIMEYLEGTCNVERFMAEMIQDGASENRIRTFLRELAQALNGLQEAGAFHQDLSGKNILTRKGEIFYFIDLESILPVEQYTRKMHYKNHVQLYDSFCDFLGDDMLEPFLAQMLPQDQDYATWSKVVRRGQAARRSRQISIWRKQGKSF